MKRKILTVVLTASLVSISLAGCGTKADKPVQDAKLDSAASSDDTQVLESGEVALTIWVEEANFDNLSKMVESFKQEYAGQADFNITLEASADADTRKNVLGDIHSAADIFSMPDDQLYSMIAGGALSPVAEQDKIKNANLEEAMSFMHIRIRRTTAISFIMIKIILHRRMYRRLTGFLKLRLKMTKNYQWNLIRAGICIHSLEIRDLILASMMTVSQTIAVGTVRRGRLKVLMWRRRC